MVIGWMDGWMDGWMNTPSGLRMPSPTLHLITYEKLTVLLCIPLIQKLIVEYKKKEFAHAGPYAWNTHPPLFIHTANATSSLRCQHC